MILIIVIIISLLVIALFIWAAMSNSNQTKKFAKDFARTGLKIGTKDLLNPGIDESFIALDTKKENLIFMKLGSRAEMKIIELKKVKSVALETDGETIYKKSIGNTAARAIIGGVVFGGLGAVIGAVTGTPSKIEKLNRASIVTDGDSGGNCYLHFVDDTIAKASKRQRLQLAEKWVRIIENNIS
ncbi:MAG: hypothetical protein K0S09_619 [Sphingobacteriaceae bacterium]|jgi:hypothetical protein|nr:hypothetical protein [Sphingobacteriaceae bacterium]